MIYSPFPYVEVTDKDKLLDGYLCRIPHFCALQYKTNVKCIEHYKQVTSYGRAYKCPYGFCSWRQVINGRDLILTSLNVEKICDKKEVQKRIASGEWIPRLPYERFQQTVLTLAVPIGIDAIQNELKEKEDKIENDKITIDDTLHEIRKLNNQLKSNAESLTVLVSSKEVDINLLEDISKSFYANTDLLSKRLNAYDFLIHPESSANDICVDFPIYKKFEKAYKCLYSLRHKNNVNVLLEGESVASVKAKDILELAIYMIMENAIKYSKPGEIVRVAFKETPEKVIVKLQNWGLQISENEWCELTKRGYRGKNARDNSDVKGSGIGLYLFKQICDDNNVQYKLEAGNDRKCIDGLIYRPFIVEMTFRLIK